MIERLESGIRNAVWYSPINYGLATNQRLIGVDFRDRHGHKWRSMTPVSVELLDDPGASVWILRIAWEQFTRFLTRRYQETQEWVYADLNPRSKVWKWEHPEVVEGWYPRWDWDDEAS
jgi:hypothetical protein